MNGEEKVRTAPDLFPPCDPWNRMHRLSDGETNPTRYGRASGSRRLLRYKLVLGTRLSPLTSNSIRIGTDVHVRTGGERGSLQSAHVEIGSVSGICGISGLKKKYS